MKLLILAFAVIISSHNAIASGKLMGNGGDHVGNGGDICENRFILIRSDLSSWILNGGGSGLTLPPKVSLSQYVQSMLLQISSAKVNCIDEKVFVGRAEKTCKNFFDSEGMATIICNASRFLNTPQSDQYVLVHHEYAGLSAFEVNDGETSRYEISNQITMYLEDQTVKKLGIKPRDVFNPKSCTGPHMTYWDLEQLIPPGVTSKEFAKTVIATFDIYTRERNCNTSGCTDWVIVPNRMGVHVNQVMPKRGSIILSFEIPKSKIFFELQAGVQRSSLSATLDCGFAGEFDGTCTVSNNQSNAIQLASGTITPHCAMISLSQKDPSTNAATWTERENVFTSKY